MTSRRSRPAALAGFEPGERVETVRLEAPGLGLVSYAALANTTLKLLTLLPVGAAPALSDANV